MRKSLIVALALLMSGCLSWRQDAPATYYIIDLSAGPNATSYQVSTLFDVPASGWTDEYKTAKLVLRRIEAGSFKMGGTTDTTISKPFYIGVFEVTQKQYELVMGTNPSCFRNWECSATHPVERITYNMLRGTSAGSGWPASSAVDNDSFFGRIRARTGLDLDLPTEAQWEYACRAGTTSIYNNGGDSEADLKKLGQYGKARVYHGGVNERGTATVGSYLPNAWGLYDMHGNVWEWCLDWMGDLKGGTDPDGPYSGTERGRILRGGCWAYDGWICGSSIRGNSPPARDRYNLDSYGFRVCGRIN